MLHRRAGLPIDQRIGAGTFVNTSSDECSLEFCRCPVLTAKSHEAYDDWYDVIPIIMLENKHFSPIKFS